LWEGRASDLLERIETEEVAVGVAEWVEVDVVRPGHRRVDRSPGVVKELVLQSLRQREDRLALDDREHRVAPLLPAERVLFSLGPPVIDVRERHLIEVADPRVEVAGTRCRGSSHAVAVSRSRTSLV
jgi:hypothetical protein